MKPESRGSRSNRVMADTPGAHGSPGGLAEEAEWLAAARKGDTGAFRRLVERHHGSAVGLAFRMVRSRADAEEVAQDAFVRAWRALPAFRGECRFRTWLHRIVVRRALDRSERLRVRARRETGLDEAPAPILNPAVEETSILRRRLEEAMMALNERERMVVALYYHEDRSVEEVAATLELPAGTVKTLLSRARARMRSRIMEVEGDGSS